MPMVKELSEQANMSSASLKNKYAKLCSFLCTLPLFRFLICILSEFYPNRIFAK